jgi:N-acetylmuramoyl-L-alanine amidase
MLVSIILLASLAVILLNQISGAKPNPNPTGLTGLPSVSTQGTKTTAPTGSSATSAPVRALSIQTPVPLGEPGAAQPEMKRWPASSSVETVRMADIAAYVGKDRSDSPLRGITVVLDPGHGGIDSGCGWPVGVREQDIMEKDVVLSVAQSAKDALHALGAEVILLREDDTFLSIFSRPATVGRILLDDFSRQTQAIGLG